jgi:peptidoglycan hydrolase CwlO-like protein
MKNKTKKSLLIIGWLVAVPAFMFSQFSFWGISTPPIAQAKTAAQIQAALDKAIQQRAELEQNLGQIQTAVVTTQKKINQSKAVIQDTAQAITQKEQEVEDLNSKIELQKQLLTSFMQQVYYSQQQTPMDIVLSEGNFLDIFGNADHLETMSDKIRQVVSDINDTQDQVEADKEGLAQTKTQTEQIVAQTANVQQGLLSDQADTQQSIDDKNATIAKLQQELVQLQGDVGQMTGKSYSIDEIWSAVKKASKNTGVPKGFLMGILGTETHFGSNIGTGTYKTDMNPAQRSTFVSLCKSLGYDPSKMPVSRRICYNTKAADHCGGWGGAMGVEQFIPTTWMAYSDRVSNKTGNSPSDPWNLDDGITAMAIKLSNTPGVTSGSRSALKTATCSYLGTCSASYINSVMYWVDNYQDVLNG